MREALILACHPIGGNPYLVSCVMAPASGSVTLFGPFRFWYKKFFGDVQSNEEWKLQMFQRDTWPHGSKNFEALKSPKSDTLFGDEITG